LLYDGGLNRRYNVMGFLDTWRSINFVGGIEITEIPEDYVSGLQPNDKPVAYTQAFQSILRGMMLIDTPVTLRLERIDNKTRVFYLTWAHNEKDLTLRVDSLETTLNAYLPKFTLRRHSEFAGVSIDPQLKGVTSFLLGSAHKPDDGGIRSPSGTRERDSAGIRTAN
jgi:hypothetical protein